MTIKAFAEQDWMRDSVRIHLGEVNAQGDLVHVFTWRGEVKVVTDAAPLAPSSDDGLELRDDIARAVYEALAEHFGHSGHDVRALRRDYDAERARVDLLIGSLVKPNRLS